MFISKLEKQQINNQINELKKKIDSLESDVTYHIAWIKSVKKMISEPTVQKKQRTAEQKKKQAAYMREWHRKNKLKKLAEKAQ